MNSVSPIQVSVPYERWNRGTCVDLVTTVATSILLVCAVSLTIYYAIHPGVHIVCLTSTFSLPLPLLITGSTGVVLTTVLMIQLARHKSVSKAILKPLHAPIRFTIHYGGRIFGNTTEDYFEAHGHHLYEVSLTTRDNVHLRGIWNFNDATSPTVVLFSGSGENAHNIYTNLGSYYIKRNYNVLCVDYRGYGMSEGSAAGPNQEIEAYLDAEAALNYVLAQGIKKEQIVAHGYSLGGTYAAALGYFFDIPKVVLDHAFTSAEGVLSHIIPLPHCVVRSAVKSAYAEAEVEACNFGIRPLKTDGFDTLAKVRAMSGQVFVIQGERDRLIPQRFGREFAANSLNNHVIIPGGHSTNIRRFPEQLETLSNFLN